MTRAHDPRGASRRHNTTFGEEIGLDVANHVPYRHRTYHPPSTIQQITAAIRLAQKTGKCTICGEEVLGYGATCKRTSCISLWVLGR